MSKKNEIKVDIFKLYQVLANKLYVVEQLSNRIDHPTESVFCTVLEEDIEELLCECKKHLDADNKTTSDFSDDSLETRAEIVIDEVDELVRIHEGGSFSRLPSFR